MQTILTTSQIKEAQMKKTKTLFFHIVLWLALLAGSHLKAATATFAPHEGDESFTKIFDAIAQAEKYVYVTVYSWSNPQFDKALEEALSNNVDVRVVLHPSLSRKESIVNRAEKFEALGAYFKVATINMHEKFVIVDGKFLVNTSANMSLSAINNYSENFIFIEAPMSQAEQYLFQDFLHEFTLLWGVSRDVITNNEELAPALPKYEVLQKSNPAQKDQKDREEETSQAIFYSSSMNFTLSQNKPSSTKQKQGRQFSLVRKGGKENQIWTIRDEMIAAIKNAEHSVHLSLNHFNIKEISDALIEVVKEKEIEVFLTVDNQEYSTSIKKKEMTPRFVHEWKKHFGKDSEPPVRVKYYSHAPSYRFWRLNHHKYMLIDYNTPQAQLWTGSYNLSKTAEHNQFDNMVVFSGPEFENLYEDFYDEFLYLWNLNRTEDDKPEEKILNRFSKKVRGAYPLHIFEAISLTFSEIRKLRREIIRKAPGIYQGIGKHRHCKGFHPEKQEYVGCPL